MKRFVVYDSNGKILRAGSCSDGDFSIQAKNNEFVIEGVANDITHKIVKGKIVNKTPEEIEADKSPEPEPVPFEQQKTNITNEQYQNILSRLDKLET